MYATHRLEIEADNGADILFVCPHEGCRRRVVVKRAGGLVVLDQGDFFALHVGGTEPIEVTGTTVV